MLLLQAIVSQTSPSKAIYIASFSYSSLGSTLDALLIDSLNCIIHLYGHNYQNLATYNVTCICIVVHTRFLSFLSVWQGNNPLNIVSTVKRKEGCEDHNILVSVSDTLKICLVRAKYTASRLLQAEMFLSSPPRHHTEISILWLIICHKYSLLWMLAVFWACWVTKTMTLQQKKQWLISISFLNCKIVPYCENVKHTSICWQFIRTRDN